MGKVLSGELTCTETGLVFSSFFGFTESWVLVIRVIMVLQYIAGLQIRRSNKDNLGIIIHISSEKHNLWAIIRTVSSRRF